MCGGVPSLSAFSPPERALVLPWVPVATFRLLYRFYDQKNGSATHRYDTKLISYSMVVHV